MTREYRGGLIAGVAYPKAALAIVWGLYCFFPGSLFATSPVYVNYAHFAPEWAWGAYAVVAGITQAAGIFKGYAGWILVGALALLMLFLWGAILFLMASTRSAAGAFYLLFSVSQAFVILMVGNALGKR